MKEDVARRGDNREDEAGETGILGGDGTKIAHRAGCGDACAGCDVCQFGVEPRDQLSEKSGGESKCPGRNAGQAVVFRMMDRMPDGEKRRNREKRAVAPEAAGDDPDGDDRAHKRTRSVFRGGGKGCTKSEENQKRLNF